MDNKKKLGKRIQELRKLKGLTQEQLAEKIGLEQNSISVIESGRNFPTLITLEKISNILEVKLSVLFEFEHIQDIDILKTAIQNSLNQMTSSEIQQLFKYIKNVMNK